MRGLLPLLLTLALALPSRAEAPLRVLVLDLDAQDVPAAWARLISELIAEQLAQQGLQVTTRADLATIAELEGERAAAGCDDNSCLSELAGAIGARMVIYGDVALLKPSYMLSLKRFDAKRGSIDERRVRMFRGAEALPDLVRELVPDLMGDLAPIQLPVSVDATGKPGLRAPRAPDAEDRPKPRAPLQIGPDSRVFGEFLIRARYESGGGYTGHARTHTRSDGTVRFEWSRVGQTPIVAYGMIIGDRVYASWESIYAGVNVYELEDGALRGVFVHDGGKRIGRETGARAAAGEGWIGTWKLKGGSARSLVVKPGKGGVFNAVWTTTEGEKVVGFGIEQDGRLVLAYHLGAFGLTWYELGDDALRGGWLNANGDRADETLTRRESARRSGRP